MAPPRYPTRDPSAVGPNKHACRPQGTVTINRSSQYSVAVMGHQLTAPTTEAHCLEDSLHTRYSFVVYGAFRFSFVFFLHMTNTIRGPPKLRVSVTTPLQPCVANQRRWGSLACRIQRDPKQCSRVPLIHTKMIRSIYMALHNVALIPFLVFSCKTHESSPNM